MVTLGNILVAAGNMMITNWAGGNSKSCVSIRCCSPRTTKEQARVNIDNGAAGSKIGTLVVHV